MILVEQARSEHLDHVLRLQSSSHEAPQWSRDVYEQIVQAAYQEDASDKLLLHRILLVARESETAAVVAFAVAAALSGEAELESVVVADGERLRGIGRRLCVAAMDWAAGAGASVMQLEVRASNVAANALYTSLGFVRTGMRRGYYIAPAEDAVQMSVELHAVDL